MASAGIAPAEARRRRNVVGPLILLGAGIVLLLNNLGVVPWSIWATLWPFWPVLFILLGLEAFVTGRVAWGAVLLAILLVGIGSFVVGASVRFGGRGFGQLPPGAPTSQFRQDVGGATRGLVRVEYGGGALRIGALDDGGALAEGRVYGRETGAVETRYRVRDGLGELTVRPRGERFGFPWGRDEGRGVDLRLNRTVPLELRVETGATEATLDLRELQVTELRLETGASRTTITTPATGQTRARIEGGATQLTVQVPPDVAARISVESGLSDVRIDESRFPRQGGEYRSPDYEGATNRVDLNISVGAARVDIQ